MPVRALPDVLLPLSICFYFLFFYFIKLYLTDYVITVVLMFPSLIPSTQHPLLHQAIPTPFFMSRGHVYKFFGYSLSYTVLYIPTAVL